MNQGIFSCEFSLQNTWHTLFWIWKCWFPSPLQHVHSFMFTLSSSSSFTQKISSLGWHCHPISRNAHASLTRGYRLHPALETPHHTVFSGPLKMSVQFPSLLYLSIVCFLNYFLSNACIFYKQYRKEQNFLPFSLNIEITAISGVPWKKNLHLHYFYLLLTQDK